MIGERTKIVATIGLPRNFKLINRFQTRQVFFDKLGTSSFENNYEYLLTDLHTLIALKTSVNHLLTVGYRIRFTNNMIIHQSIQQFSITQTFNSFRLGHRFSSDQTYLKDNFMLRVRYRATLEKPLKGDKIDPREFYIKFNTEVMYVVDQEKSNAEVRIAPYLGYELNVRNKFEFGVDYRIDNFNVSKLRNRFLITFGWYVKLTK